MGNLRHGKKSDLVPCLQTIKLDKIVPDSHPVAKAEVLDSAALVHMLPPKDVKTKFNEYVKCMYLCLTFDDIYRWFEG